MEPRSDRGAREGTSTWRLHTEKVRCYVVLVDCAAEGESTSIAPIRRDMQSWRFPTETPRPPTPILLVGMVLYFPRNTRLNRHCPRALSRPPISDPDPSTTPVRIPPHRRVPRYLAWEEVDGDLSLVVLYHYYP